VKVVVTSNGGIKGKAADHFGRCRDFVIFDIEGKEIKKSEVVKNPYFEKHIPGAVPKFISSQKANVVITVGAGPMAVEMLKSMGIKVIFANGKVEEVVDEFLKGNLKDEDNSCSH